MLQELRTRADQTNPQQQNDDTNGGAEDQTNPQQQNHDTNSGVEVDVTVSSGRIFHQVAPFDQQRTTKMGELIVTQIVSTFDLVTSCRLPNTQKYPTLSHHDFSDSQKFMKTFLGPHLCAYQHAILQKRSYSQSYSRSCYG